MAQDHAKSSALREIPSDAQDAITCVRFSPSGYGLAVASIDCCVYFYHNNMGRSSFEKFARVRLLAAPAFDVCWGMDDMTAFSAGGGVVKFELGGGQPGVRLSMLSTQSTHDVVSSKVVYSKEYGIVISTSWDGTMNVHDPASRNCVRIRLAAKPYAISLTAERAVVAMAERKVAVYNLNALKMLVDQAGGTTVDEQGAHAHKKEILEVQPWQERESSLKFMTRAVACMIDGTGFATSSIEGRVGVEWFDPEEQKRTYAFKCHRQAEKRTNEDGVEEEVDIIYPVNALAFHPVHGTFATGGGDGVVALWDAQTKRRVKQYHKLDTNIAALDFSPDGRYLAIAITPLPTHLVKFFNEKEEREAMEGAQETKAVQGVTEAEVASQVGREEMQNGAPEIGGAMQGENAQDGGVGTEVEDAKNGEWAEENVEVIVDARDRAKPAEDDHPHHLRGYWDEEGKTKSALGFDLSLMKVFIRELGENEAKGKEAKSKSGK